MNQSLVAETKRPPELSSTVRDVLFSLLSESFDRVSRVEFELDLKEKDQVVLLVDQAGEVKGFSTFMFKSVGDGVGVLYSGDTIIDQAFWGSQELPRAGLAIAMEAVSSGRAAVIYWLLISKGYKTFRYLPLLFKEFYPNPAVPEIPRDMLAVAAGVLGPKFGPLLDLDLGIVRSGGKGPRLKQGVADLTPGRLKDSDIAFFSSLNPGWSDGDNLICMARVHPDNFTRAAIRLSANRPRRIESKE